MEKHCVICYKKRYPLAKLSIKGVLTLQSQSQSLGDYLHINWSKFKTLYIHESCRRMYMRKFSKHQSIINSSGEIPFSSGSIVSSSETGESFEVESTATDVVLSEANSHGGKIIGPITFDEAVIEAEDVESDFSNISESVVLSFSDNSDSSRNEDDAKNLASQFSYKEKCIYCGFGIDFAKRYRDMLKPIKVKRRQQLLNALKKRTPTYKLECIRERLLHGNLANARARIHLRCFLKCRRAARVETEFKIEVAGKLKEGVVEEGLFESELSISNISGSVSSFSTVSEVNSVGFSRSSHCNIAGNDAHSMGTFNCKIHCLWCGFKIQENRSRQRYLRAIKPKHQSALLESLKRKMDNRSKCIREWILSEGDLAITGARIHLKCYKKCTYNPVMKEVTAVSSGNELGKCIGDSEFFGSAQKKSETTEDGSASSSEESGEERVLESAKIKLCKLQTPPFRYSKNCFICCNLIKLNENKEPYQYLSESGHRKNMERACRENPSLEAQFVNERLKVVKNLANVRAKAHKSCLQSLGKISRREKLRCSIHKRKLIKVSPDGEHLCCVGKCSRLSRWKCNTRKCIIGICGMHGYDVRAAKVVVHVKPMMRGRCHDLPCIEDELNVASRIEMAHSEDVESAENLCISDEKYPSLRHESDAVYPDGINIFDSELNEQGSMSIDNSVVESIVGDFIIPNLYGTESDYGRLEDIVAHNGCRLVETWHHKDCLFDLVSIAIAGLGYELGNKAESVRKLRDVAAEYMFENRNEFDQNYVVEDERQASSLELFIERTRDGSEYGRSLSVKALALSFGITIKIILPIDEHPWARIDTYGRNLKCGNSLTLACNNVTHYLGVEKMFPLRNEPECVSGEVYEVVRLASAEVERSSTPSECVVLQDNLFSLTIPPLHGEMNHYKRLEYIVDYNMLQIVQTESNGNCFFDAVAIGLERLGYSLGNRLERIRGIRERAADFLEENSDTYRDMYVPEDDEQSETFDEFVANTRAGLEWATEITILALAAGLEIDIKVLMTLDHEPWCKIENYGDSINRERVIVVAYNRAAKHYLGIKTYSEVCGRSIAVDSGKVLSCENEVEGAKKGTSLDFYDVNPPNVKKSVNHKEILKSFGELNDLEIVETEAGGNCFYDALQKGLYSCGYVTSISELRERASQALKGNPKYAEHHTNVMLSENRKSSFKVFVENTRKKEWPNNMTIVALANSLNICICIFSTSDYVPHISKLTICSVEKPRCIVEVAFNLQEAHYLGIRRKHSRRTTVMNDNVRCAIVNVQESTVQPSEYVCEEMDIDDCVVVGKVARETGLAKNYDSSYIYEGMTDLEGCGDSLEEADMEVVSEDELLCNGNDVCCNCRRRSRNTIILELRLQSGPFTKRHNSLMTAPSPGESILLCSDCNEYLKKGNKSDEKLWRYGWPSVIACLLFSRKHESIRNDIWNLLPLSYQESWIDAAGSVNLHIIDPSKEVFRDATIIDKQTNDRITSGKIGDLVDEMTGNYPNVKCPAGCYEFVEQCTEVGFNHFLAWKFGLKFYGGDAKYLKGARSDWPNRIVSLGTYSVGASFKSSNGLSILMCKTHGKGLFKAIIHVPLNPVLGDLGFQHPDPLAAATLQPNVIRKGIQGTYNTSFNTVKIVSGTSGVSTSYISPCVDRTRIDNRLADANCLVMEHRQGVRHLNTKRIKEETILRDMHEINCAKYEKNGKPSDQLLNACLSGATYIHLDDAYGIHNKFFNKGIQDDEGRYHNESSKLIVLPVHHADTHGSKPFEINHHFSTKCVISNTLINMMLHCPDLYNEVVNGMERGGTYMKDLLAFMQKLISVGVRTGSGNGIRTAVECESATLVELDRIQTERVSNGKCVADILSSFSPNKISSYEIPPSLKVEDIILDDREIFIVYRNGNRRDCMGKPLSLPNGLFLMAALGGSKECSDELHFRWTKNSAFWEVYNRNGKQVSCKVGAEPAAVFDLIMPHWQILIYAKGRNIDTLRSQVNKELGGQQKMKCVTHEYFLKPFGLHCDYGCCISECHRTARYICLEDGCENCVCLMHANDILNGLDTGVVEIKLGMLGRVVPLARNDARSTENVRNVLDEESICNVNHPFSLPMCLEDLYDPRDPQAVHSRKEAVPIYDNQRRIPGHYLWNSSYRVLQRGRSSGGIQANSIMQHIYAKNDCAAESVYFPEAVLMPHIFYYEQEDTPVGAIPSFMLTFGHPPIAGLESLGAHFLIRMKDGCILTSRESGYWHLLFDLDVNEKLNCSSTELFLKRGVEHLLEQNDSRKAGEPMTAQAKLPMNETESSKLVKELSCMIKKHRWDLFHTITANHSETPGLRELRLAIKKYAAGDDKLEAELIIANLPMMCRLFEKFVRIFFEQLIMRNDSIYGKVTGVFYRFEFQGAGSKGNLPHVHAGISVEEESDETSLRRICCSSKQYNTKLFGCDYASLKDLGVFKTPEQFMKWCKVVESVNIHNCELSAGRCKKRTNEAGEKVCRMHKQPPWYSAGRSGWLKNIPSNMSERVHLLLQELDLAHKEFDTMEEKEVWVLDSSLRTGKWHYPAEQNEFFIAMHPLVSALFCSSTNLEKCDEIFQSIYLCKYAAGKEEHQVTTVAGTKDISNVKVMTAEHAHEKISGCAINLRNRKKPPGQMGREIALTEIVWYLLHLKYTYCSTDFVHVPTLPLESRAGVIKRSKHSQCFFKDGVIVPIKTRRDAGLPEWRQFTREQEAHLEDYRNSRYCLDATSRFNIRPPELLVFDNLPVYCELFATFTAKEHKVDVDLSKYEWLDGTSSVVKLRNCYIDRAVAILTAKANLGNESAKTLLEIVFTHIAAGSVEFMKRFVHDTLGREMVSVISTVKPWDRTKFLVHVCLSLGNVDTELRIFCNQDIRQAFVKAGLLNSIENITRADVLRILKLYVLEDLKFHSISRHAFGVKLCAAADTLQDALVEGVMGDYTPYALEVALKDKALQDVLDYEGTRKRNLVAGLRDDDAIRPIVPGELENTTLERPLNWNPIDMLDLNAVLEENAEDFRLSDEAKVEQRSNLGLIVEAIDKFLDPTCFSVKFPCLVGRPGSGKSHVMKMGLVYALSKGLQVELLSITAERARKLGGIHLHSAFPIPVDQGRVLFAHTTAESCLKGLERDPMKKALIKRTDVYIFEEIGMLSAEYFSAMDYILQAVMGNCLPWGGKLLISCGDSKQLPPVEGRPVWSSINMCTMMQIIGFRANVRSRDDNLTVINDMCRRELSSDECGRAADLIMNCCQFLSTWEEVPSAAMRIVSTRAAERSVLEKLLQSKETVSLLAIDEVKYGLSYKKADCYTSALLNRRVNEYDKLDLFLHAIVRMTYNERHTFNGFSQGQLAVVVGLPDPSNSESTMILRLAPPGQRLVNPMEIPAGWKRIEVRRRVTHEVIVAANIFARRTQYPVRYNLASTIHRVQGDTVTLYATQISQTERKFRLWQKEQLAVLISRAERCSDIIFVGSRDETRSALVHILSRSSKWNPLVEEYMRALDVTLHPSVRVVRMEKSPYLPMYCELPSSVVGYIYMIVSLAEPEQYFIGETLDLKRSVRKHNMGYGDDKTSRTSLHPWGVYAFICGFDLTEDGYFQRRRLVNEIRCLCCRRDTPIMVYERIETFLSEEYFRHLTLVKCARECENDEVILTINESSVP